MHPIELDAILKLAKAKLRGGQGPEAEAMYRQVLAEQPQNAEALHFMGLSAMQRGKLEEALGLVRRSIELDDARADYHNNLAIVLGRMGRVTESLGAAQRAIELDDEFAEAYSNKGVALERLGRAEEAIESYRRAVELRGDYAEALSNLGGALSRLGEHAEAIQRLRRAAELRPRCGECRKNLGTALRRAGRPPEAVVAYRMAVELNPRDGDAYNNLGAALQEAGRVREAEQALRTCLSINPNHTDAHWNLGLALLALGRWREGWIEYEWRRHLREDLGQRRGFPQPAWNGAPLAGLSVLVLCEQGLGDTIQFVRYVPLLARRGANVIVECQSKLRPLLAGIRTPQGSDAGTSTGSVGTASTSSGAGASSGSVGSVQVIARGEPLPAHFDVHARLLTLPCIFGSTPQDLPGSVPYLDVEPERVARWRDELRREDAGTRGRGEGPNHRVPASSRLRVGLVWQGSTAHKGDRYRSIPLSAFAPLANVPGVRLVSLQKGYGSEQLDQPAQDGGPPLREAMDILEWSDPTDTTAEALLDTAAVMRNLDLVIAVDTSVAHLAGALGVATWVALPLAADWRWLLDRADTPWYPTMRLFRQAKLGDWPAVIERMAEALAEKLAARAPADALPAELATI